MDETGSYWKLGLFVVVAISLGIATLFWLGAGSLQSERPLRLVTYFDESVQGLSVGAEVKFRGVKIGEIASIAISEDMSHLEVVSTIFRDAVKNNRWFHTGSTTVPHPIPELRAQLVSANLTGQKFVSLEPVGATVRSGSENVPEGIRPPPDCDLFIPSRPSTLKSFEDALNNALVLFGDIGPDVGSIVSSLETMLRNAQDAGLPEQARGALADLRQTLERASGAAGSFQSRVDGVDTAALSSASITLIERSTHAVDTLQTLLDSITTDGAPETHLSRRLGALMDFATDEIRRARVPDTTQDIRDAATAVRTAANSVEGTSNQIGQLTDDLELTLRSLRETIDALRGLILVLEHDPSSILRGRTYGTPPPALERGNSR